MYVCVCIETKAHDEVSKGEKACANDDESKGNAVRVAATDIHKKWPAAQYPLSLRPRCPHYTRTV